MKTNILIVLLLSTVLFSCSNSDQTKTNVSSENLTIVAKILAKPEHSDLVKTELLKLIEITRNEKGCLNYDLHQDNENPNLFLFYENWTSRELWQIHMNAAHLKAYMEATKEAVEKFTLHEMTYIE